MTRPVVAAVSHATRHMGSFAIRASRIASEIASHILSGCPSVTDSEVKMFFSILFCPFRLCIRKSSPNIRTAFFSLQSFYCSISRSGWAPSCIAGVAVASQILCISTTLNKRHYNIIFILHGDKNAEFPSPLKPFRSQLPKASVFLRNSHILSGYIRYRPRW